ncbi:hypothetical protein C2S51_003829 [Perilla frutescens var. frutescens]|nr:hypothetical protein C2S51_003829 [Perilla frutescens var. frutescens]
MIVGDEAEDEEKGEAVRFMKDRFLFVFNNNSKRTRWDCSFAIRSRGRWGKCG